MKRYLLPFIKQDLKQKMVFIGGPRQVGKTTLSKNLAESANYQASYLNWDSDEDRRIILKKQWSSDDTLIIFDDLHKYKRWKQWIKGIYDTRLQSQNYLVTGSAKLDVYRRGGDSLMGRYHYWRLHPLTLDELPVGISLAEGYQRLITLGGFPEPFLMNDKRETRRWRKDRFDRILREDVIDLEHVREIQLLQLFVDALRERVGNLITLNNLAQDLQISPKTAKAWLELVERMYIAFSIRPLTKNVPRSILKPPKVFFYDNGDVLNNAGAKLENLVATHLLKRLHFIEDYYGHRCSLHYIRDKDGREIDFAIVIDGKLKELIEVKMQDETISTALKYYKEKLNPEKTYQIVGNLKRSYDQNGIRVISIIEYFKNPPWEMQHI